MKRAFLLSALLACVGKICAAEAPTLFQQAQQALGNGVRPVAIVKLRQFIEAKPMAKAEREARLLLAATLLDDGQTDGVAKWLEGASGDPRADFLRGRLALAEQHWEEARMAFALVNTPEARLGEADALVKLNRRAEAMELLQKVPDAAATLRLAELKLESGDADEAGDLLKHLKTATAAETDWKGYLEARVLLEQRQYALAHIAFEDLLRRGRHLSERILVGATLGLANVRTALSGPDAADNVIEDFISQNPDSAFLGELFQRLDQIYDQEESPSDSPLDKWLRDATGTRTAYAEFYKARRELRDKRTERALRRLAAFIQSYPAHPLVPQAFLLSGQVLMKSGQADQALAMFEEAMRRAPDENFRAETEMAAGALQFAKGDYLLAVNLFRSAGQREPRLLDIATTNMALAWLKQGNEAKFREQLATLEQRPGTGEAQERLWLEEGMTQARLGDRVASTSTLQQFLRRFPDSLRQAKANIALAEIAMQNVPPRAEDAGDYLRVANDVTPRLQEDGERADFLAIFVADAGGQNEKAGLDRGEAFLRKHPQSRRGAEVRMKLGEIYYRLGDFVNAQNQLETLARDTPGSPLVESALYMAGQAAMQTMSTDGLNHSLELFYQVVKLGGPLRLYARQQQALAQIKLGREAEAVTIYDNILTATPPPPPELQVATLLGKGKALFTLGAHDATKYALAAVVFSQLASQKGAEPSARNQAAYMRGKCLENQGRADDALAAYYDVVERQTAPDAPAAEYLWTSKAAFDAARMLKEKQNWAGAIGVYEMLAKLGGPRADEAKRNADDLRLQHYIWEG